MVDREDKHPRRILIASANPLFAHGLRRLLTHHWDPRLLEIGLTSTMEESLQAMNELCPDLVIVDYDDRSIDREMFLSHFVAGSHTLIVMLVSLQDSGTVVVYDRRTMSPLQAEAWLTADSFDESSEEQQDCEEGGMI
jgi:cytochrome c oxidase subunit 2